MNQADQYLIDKIERRVSFYEMRLPQVDERYLAQVEKLDPMLAQLVQPGRIKSVLDTTRYYLTMRKIVEADQGIERLERQLLYVEQKLTRPIFSMGLKFFGERGGRRDLLTRAIDEALEQLGREATPNAVLDHIRAARGIDIDSDKAIFWRNAKGREKTTTFKSFQNRIAKRRKLSSTGR